MNKSLHRVGPRIDTEKLEILSLALGLIKFLSAYLVGYLCVIG